MNIYTSENEMLKEELKAANAWIKASEKIIVDQDASLKLALEALELVNLEFVCGNGSHHAKKDRHEWDEPCPITDRWKKAIAAAEEALAQPEYRAVKTYHEGKPVYVAQQEQNLNCKSTQARLATAWGYVKAQPEQESFEYWNAVEGWVKIDEVREHFDSVGCGTIYKTAGEGRVPLCVAQRKPLTDEQMFKIWLTVPAEKEDRFAFARAIEAAHGIGDNT